MSTSRPSCLILDAGPIIGLHELGAWKAFVERYEVVVPQLVLDDEALFHSKDAATGHSEPIDLAADVGSGRVLAAAAAALRESGLDVFVVITANLTAEHAVEILEKARCHRAGRLR